MSSNVTLHGKDYNSGNIVPIAVNADGELLVYTGIVFDLPNLSDVMISSLTGNNLLQYDVSINKWINTSSLLGNIGFVDLFSSGHGSFSNISVAGLASLANLVVSRLDVSSLSNLADVNITANLDVLGITSLANLTAGNISITGLSNLSRVIITSNLDVFGFTSLSNLSAGNLVVSGVSNLTTLGVSGVSTLANLSAGNLVVTGVSNLTTLGVSGVTSLANVSAGNLVVTGVSNLTTLGVSGVSTLANLNVGNIMLSSNLFVGERVILNNNQDTYLSGATNGNINIISTTGNINLEAEKDINLVSNAGSTIKLRGPSGQMIAVSQPDLANIYMNFGSNIGETGYGFRLLDGILKKRSVGEVNWSNIGDGGSGGGSSNLAGLTDIDLTFPLANLQLLQYEQSSNKWINKSDLVLSGNLDVSGITNTGSLTFGNENKIRIGQTAGETGQGANTIAIGYGAGQTNQHSNTIVLNTTGIGINTDDSGRFYLAPLRSVPGFATGNKAVKYNASTKEVVYEDNNDVLLFGANSTGSTQPLSVTNTGVLKVFNAATTPSLANLSDTHFTSLANNDVLIYNQYLTKWVNESELSLTKLTVPEIFASSGSNLNLRSTSGNVNITAEHDIVLSANSPSSIKLLGTSGQMIAVSQPDAANIYMNFGSNIGETGYGFRLLDGILKKRSVGEVDWSNIGDGGSGGSSNLAELNDVNLSLPLSNLQLLQYDLDSGKWVNNSNLVLSNNFSVSGITTLANLAAGNLEVSGVSTINSASLSSNLSVSGITTLANVTAGNLEVSGTIDLQSLTFGEQNKIRIGQLSGETGQGANTIAIGYAAGQTNQHSNTIVLNTTGIGINTDDSGRFYLAPLRSVPGFGTGNKSVKYNASTKEVVYEDNNDVLLYGANSTGYTQPLSVTNTGVLKVYNTATTPSLANLSDTHFTSLANNDVLIYDQDISKWVNASDLILTKLTVPEILANTGGNLDIRASSGNVNITAENDIVLTSNSPSTIKLLGPSGQMIAVSQPDAANVYMNFGSGSGESGYGFRLLDGILKKRSVGDLSWSNIGDGGSGGVSALSNLTDVTLTLPLANLQLLQYDLYNDKWVNKTDLVLSGNLAIASNLSVSGITTLANVSSGNLSVSGVSSLSSASLSSNLSVSGITTLANVTAGNLSVSGVSSLSSASLSSNLSVSGITTLGNVTAGNLSVSGVSSLSSASLSSNLSVSGITTLGNVTAGNLSVTGISALTEANISGNILVSGNTNIQNLNQNNEYSQIKLGNLSFTNGYRTHIEQGVSYNGSYAGLLTQNKSTGSQASTNLYLVGDDTDATGTSNYAVVGRNNSNYNMGADYLGEAPKCLYIGNSDGDTTIYSNFFATGNVHFAYQLDKGISITNTGALSVNTTYTAATNSFSFDTGNSGNVLVSQGNSTHPIWKALNLSNLADLLLTSLSNNDLLQYNSTTGSWENRGVLLGNVGFTNINVTGNTTLLNVTTSNLDTQSLLFGDENKIRIGQLSGETGQGANTIAIGYAAGQTNQHSNTIVLNTTNTALNTLSIGGLYIAPVRSVSGYLTGNKPIKYNESTKEIVYENTTEVVAYGSNSTGSLQPFSLSNTGVLKIFNTATTPSLANLSDIQFTNLANNNIITYNQDLSKWVNSANIIVNKVTANQLVTTLGNLDIQSAVGNVNITANHDIVLTANSPSTIKLFGPAGSEPILISMLPDGNSYINFGSVSGETGAGIRYTDGNVFIKSASGNWSGISNTQISIAGRTIELGGSNTIGFSDLTGSIDSLNQINIGSIGNDKLTNSNITIAGYDISLGDGITIDFSNLTGTINSDNQIVDSSILSSKFANAYIIIGDSNLTVGGVYSGIDVSNSTGYQTSNLVGTITNTQLAGSITNDKLANSTITLGGRLIELGGSNTIATSNLSDVSFTLPVANNEVLTYNTTLNKWTNAQLGEITAELGYYGSFNSNITQDNIPASNARIMRCNNVISAKGISVDANGTFTVENPGVYLVTLEAQLRKTGPGNDIVNFWFRKNNQDVPQSNLEFTVIGLGGKMVAAYNYVFVLEANDKIDVIWYSVDSTISLLYQAATAYSPETPSCVVAFTPVQYIQDGTLNMGDLLNVSTTGQANNHVLQYNSDLSRWDTRANLTINAGSHIFLGSTANIGSNTSTGNLVINTSNLDIVVSQEAHVHNNLRVTGNIFLSAATNTANIISPINGNLNVNASNLILTGSSKTVITGAATQITGNATVTSGTGSSSTTTGALVVTGGAGVSGNVYVGGVVSQASWLPGQVIKMSVLTNTDIGLTTYNNNVGTTGYTQVGSYSYTPLSSSSYLFITFQSRFTVSGTTNDSWYSQIAVDGSEVGYIFTQFLENSGSSLRTQPLFPLQGRYTNSSTASKTIAINAKRDSSDDNLTINGDNSTWLTITEIAR